MLFRGKQSIRDCLTVAFGIILIFLFLTNLSSSAAALPPSDGGWAHETAGGIASVPQTAHQAVDAFQDRLISNALVASYGQAALDARSPKESAGGSILAMLQSKLGWFQGKLTSFLTQIWGSATAGRSHSCS